MGRAVLTRKGLALLFQRCPLLHGHLRIHCKEVDSSSFPFASYHQFTVRTINSLLESSGWWDGRRWGGGMMAHERNGAGRREGGCIKEELPTWRSGTSRSFHMKSFWFPQVPLFPLALHLFLTFSPISFKMRTFCVRHKTSVLHRSSSLL